MINNVFEQIQDVTSKLISISLSVEQNFPSKKNGVIYISNKTDASIALKNLPYEEIYLNLDREKNYNIKMIDGALLQLMYQFDGSALLRHRLAFFPSPNLEEFQNNLEIYETDEIYADIIAKNIVTAPIRFDYDPGSHVLISHPRSHLTVGQYKNCRIPVSQPLSPYLFIEFILRNFYNTAYKKHIADLKFTENVTFSTTIEQEEKNILHLSLS